MQNTQTMVKSTLIGLSFLLIGTSSAFAQTVIGNTEVPLDAIEINVRTQETNLGDLIADSFLWQAQQNGFAADVSLLNGGSIRTNTIFPVGNITDQNIVDWLPFNGDLMSFDNLISPTDFRNFVENGLETVNPDDDGRFPQIAGFNFTYNPNLPEGSRIVDLYLDNNTPIVENGAVVSGAPSVSLITNDFLAGGGDSYPLLGAFTDIGTTSQQALTNYISDANGLNGTVTAIDYPEGGNGRITANPNAQATPEPSAILGLGIVIGIGALSRKQK